VTMPPDASRPGPTGARAAGPFCECGCGYRVLTRTNGVWSRYRSGHHNYGPAARLGDMHSEGGEPAASARPVVLPPSGAVSGTQLSMMPDIAPDYDVPAEPT